MRVISNVVLSVILLVVTGILMAVASFAPELFFGFYTDFSQNVLSAISGVTQKLPFALWEPLALVLVLVAVYSLIRRFRPLGWLTGILAALSVGVCVFSALWGLNYFAPEVSDRLGMETQPYTVQELKDTTSYMAQQAQLLCDSVSRDEEGNVVADFDLLAASAHDGYDALAQRNAFFEKGPRQVKKLLSGRLFSHMGFTGIFVPFTAECNVNPETYPGALPFTMCHELAHGKTVAREDEANFCAFLACVGNDDPSFQYSGWYSAFLYTYNSLKQADPAAALEIMDGLSQTLRRDLAANNAHYAQYDSSVQDVAQKANDLYLKAAGDENGAESYGKVTDLLVAWYLAAQK
ncbi:MAG: DUF3810 domain-containing protein [Oscillospiraceae bacterium]|nr:DUF3810 domain-containing protein [Oscillospiraceae bacterium]